MFSEDDVLKLSIHGFNNLKWAFIFNIPTMSVSQKLYLKNSEKPVYFVQVLSLIVYIVRWGYKSLVGDCTSFVQP